MTSRLLEKFDHFRTDLFEDAAASFDHGGLDLVLRDGLELVAVVDEQLTAQLADGDHERGRRRRSRTRPGPCSRRRSLAPRQKSG